MKKLITSLRNCLQKKSDITCENKAVEYSAKKYQKTYKLLEKYGEAKQSSRFLVDSENIRRYFQ